MLEELHSVTRGGGALAEARDEVWVSFGVALGLGVLTVDPARLATPPVHMQEDVLCTAAVEVVVAMLFEDLLLRVRKALDVGGIARGDLVATRKRRGAGGDGGIRLALMDGDKAAMRAGHVVLCGAPDVSCKATLRAGYEFSNLPTAGGSTAVATGGGGP